MSSIPKSIAIGLAKAQAYARGVDKSSRNTHGKYDYASAEDIIVEGRKSLLEGGGIAFSVTGWAFEPVEAREAKTREKGGETKALAQAIGRIKVKYLLVCIDDGEAYEADTSAPIVPEWGRPDDKAEYGALTQCHAYTLRGLLNLPRGLAGEVDMNQRRDDDDNPPSDRTPEPNREPDRARSDTPRDTVTRSPGDHAAAAQTGVDQSRGNPVRPDPAILERVVQYEARAEHLREDPGALWDEIVREKFSIDLETRALCAVACSAFRHAKDQKILDGWADYAAARSKETPWGPVYGQKLTDELNAAYERLAGPANDQAA